MRPFVYKCPATGIPVITRLYSGMFLHDGEFPFPYPCPCGHLHMHALKDEKIAVKNTHGELPQAGTRLIAKAIEGRG